MTLEIVIELAEPLAADAPEAIAIAEAGGGVGIRKVESCLPRVASLATQMESRVVVYQTGRER